MCIRDSPGRKELVLAHVLNDFSEQEKNGWVEKILIALTEHLNLLIKGDTNSLMSKIASTMGPLNEVSRVSKD